MSSINDYMIVKLYYVPLIKVDKAYLLMEIWLVHVQDQISEMLLGLYGL